MRWMLKPLRDGRPVGREISRRRFESCPSQGLIRFSMVPTLPGTPGQPIAYAKNGEKVFAHKQVTGCLNTGTVFL